MSEYHKLKELAVDYLAARHKFLSTSNKIDDLSGNDNIVGRIGELIAIQYLRKHGRNVTKNPNPVQKGFDLMTDKGDQISVKIITAENKSGRTTRIKEPWSELIFITLNSEYKVDILGHIKKAQFNKALNNGFIKTTEPYADVKLLKDNGLFDKYGGIRLTGKEVEDYL